jgi:hypothetical protein
MTDAILAHEDVHQAHLLPALQAVAINIESYAIENLWVADYGQNSEQAKSSIVANALPGVVDEALRLWSYEYDSRWPDDHGTSFNGPAYSAEVPVTHQMLQNICDHARSESWPECGFCPPS